MISSFLSKALARTLRSIEPRLSAARSCEVPTGQPRDLEAELAQSFLSEVDLPCSKILVSITQSISSLKQCAVAVEGLAENASLLGKIAVGSLSIHAHCESDGLRVLSNDKDEPR